MFLMLHSSPARLCRFLSNLPTLISSKGVRPSRAALQLTLPAQFHGGRVLVGIGIAVRLLPRRDIDNRLGELVGVPGAFGGHLLIKLLVWFALSLSKAR